MTVKEATSFTPVPRGGLWLLKWIAIIAILFFISDYVSHLVRKIRMSDQHSNITDMLNRQRVAWNAGDMPGFLSCYQMTDDTTFYADGTVEQGWVMISDRYMKRPKDQMGTLEFTDLKINVMNVNEAMVRGRWATTANGLTRSGLFTLVVRKFADGWKIVHDHTSEGKKVRE